ncbi:MAG TPA: hypothetical protein VN745_08365 [Verrucomicrobiae bacterium]|nr:hypothetical protein [Verrucomicrobiae bacterium]
MAANKFSIALPAVALALILAMLPLGGQAPKRERPEHEKDTAQLIRKRAQWFFHQRAYPLKHIPAGAQMRAVEQMQRMRAANGTFMERLLQRSALPNLSTVIGEGARQITVSSSNWTPIGPAPTNSTFFSLTSGRVNALAVDPCDASGNTIYAGAAQGGLWKTTDGGSNWTPLTDSQPSISSGSIAVDPDPADCTGGHTGAIYYGTGEENFAFDSFYGAGVLISHDGGSTWTKDNTFVNLTAGTPSTITPTNAGAAGPFVGSLAVQPGTNGATQVLLAGIQGVSSMANSGIWRSTNGGANWTRVIPTTNTTNFPAANDFGTGVVFDPANANVAYAALGIPFCASNVCGSAGDEELDNGVYKSTDGGATWTLLTSLNNAAGALGGQPSFGRITVAVGPPAQSGQPGELLVSIADISNSSSSLLGLFKSMDGGTNFSLLMNDSTGTGFCDQQCFYDMSIGISPSDPNLIFLGGGPAADGANTTQCGVFGANQGISTVIRSTDGGTTWSDVSCDATSQTFIHVDTHAFVFSNGKLYTGNDGGVWASSNAVSGAAPTQVAWSDLNTTLNLTQFYPGSSIHPSNPQLAFAGSQDNGTQMFTGNLNWNDTDACGDGGWTAIDPQVPSTVYAACAATGQFEVNKNQFDGVPGPGAQNWIALDNSAMDADNQNFIPPLVLDPSNPQNLYFGTFQVWQSTNGGVSWNTLAPTAAVGPSTQCASNGCLITTLSVAPSSSSTIYVGTDQGFMWVSNNATSVTPTFTEIDQASTPGRVVTQIVASPAAPNTAFAAFSGFSGFNGDNLGHIFETTNSGQSWTDISGNLPNTPVNDVVVDPDDVTNNTIYVATDVGVFATNDGGTTWAELANGLPHVECTSLKLNETARILQVGTHGRGVWDLQLPFAAGITSALTSISPASTTAGSGGFTMTLTGFGFPASPTVNFGSGTQLTPTTASATQITVNVPASALATSGEVAVSVTGAQNSLNFGIEGAVPTLSSNPPPSPNTIIAGNNVTLTVTGTNFNGNSEVIWTPTTGPNTGISTTLTQNAGGSSTSFTVTVPASLLSSTVGTLPPIGAPSHEPRGPGSPWFLAAACAAMLGIALLFSFPRNRRAVLGATIGMILLLPFVGGCSNNGNPPPIKLGNSATVAINVLNPAPGGGLSNTETVTVKPQ